MNTQLKHIENWLEIGREAKWKVAELAKTCRVSTRTLELHFRQTVEMSPKQWLTQERMRLAQDFLREGFSVKEIAQKLAYKSAGQFSKEFKRNWGLWPTESASSKECKFRIFA